MKARYHFTHRLLFLLACLALVTWGLHIYANWKISIPFLHAASNYNEGRKFVLKTFWLSSIPVFLFFLLTAIAGFFRKRFYLPFFFILFFWLGGAREFQEIGIAWNDFSSFGAPFTLVAWSSLLMLSTAILATISWAIEYFLWRKKSID